LTEIAVVGADGAIGSLLVRALDARPVRLRHPGERLDALCGELAGARAIVNVAGPRVRPGLTWPDYLREHVGTAEAIARSADPGAHLIHLSSAAVYGTRPGEVLDARAAESPASFPNAAYAWAKLAAELAARAIGRERGLEVTVLRVPLVYGPDLESAITSLVALARKGLAFRLAPANLRQHLLHERVLVAGLQKLAAKGKGSAAPVLLADPFVLTNEDVNAVIRSAARAPVAIPVPLRAASRAATAWPGFPAQEAPGALAAFAALAVDIELDWREAYAHVGLSAGEFSRDRLWPPS
jgi:UDP-glucose 4-epimerase